MSCTFFSFPNLQPSHILILLQPSSQTSSQPSLQPSSQPPSSIFTAILTAVFEFAANFAAILPAAFTVFHSILLRTRLVSWLSRTLLERYSGSYSNVTTIFRPLSRMQPAAWCFSTPPSLYRIKQSISPPLLRFISENLVLIVITIE